EPTVSYRWDLLEAWLPDAVAEGRRLSRAAALDRLVARYLEAAVFSTARSLGRLFGVSAAETDKSLARLRRRDVVVETTVQGWSGRWVLAKKRSPARRFYFLQPRGLSS